MYRDDDDLEFLGKVKSEDLNDLVHLLIYDKDGIERLTEELSYRDSYKRYSPDHHQYWEDIADACNHFQGRQGRPLQGNSL